MELVTLQTYHAPSFSLYPGDDTLDHPELPLERKQAMLADYPEVFAEITDLKAYRTEKSARQAARAAELAAAPEAAVKEHNPFVTSPETAMTKADRFENVVPEQAKVETKTGKRK